MLACGLDAKKAVENLGFTVMPDEAQIVEIVRRAGEIPNGSRLSASQVEVLR